MDRFLYYNGLRHERVKMGKKWSSPTYFLKLKNMILLLNRGLSIFFKWSFCNIVSTLSNVVKIDVENVNVVSTLSNIVQFNVVKQRCSVQRCSVQNCSVQRCFNVVLRCKFQRWHTHRCFNVDLTLCDVATSYQLKNNVEATMKCLLGSLSDGWSVIVSALIPVFAFGK